MKKKKKITLIGMCGTSSIALQTGRNTIF